MHGEFTESQQLYFQGPEHDKLQTAFGILSGGSGWIAVVQKLGLDIIARGHRVPCKALDVAVESWDCPVQGCKGFEMDLSHYFCQYCSVSLRTLRCSAAFGAEEGSPVYPCMQVELEPLQLLREKAAVPGTAIYGHRAGWGGRQRVLLRGTHSTKLSPSHDLLPVGSVHPLDSKYPWHPSACTAAPVFRK